jgi:hypothetical protein
MLLLNYNSFPLPLRTAAGYELLVLSFKYLPTPLAGLWERDVHTKSHWGKSLFNPPFSERENGGQEPFCEEGNILIKLLSQVVAGAEGVFVDGDELLIAL